MTKRRTLDVLIGERLRIAREMNGLKQKDVAQKVGYSNQHFSRIELGERSASLDLLLRLMKIYNKQPEFFLKDILEFTKRDER